MDTQEAGQTDEQASPPAPLPYERQLRTFRAFLPYVIILALAGWIVKKDAKIDELQEKRITDKEQGLQQQRELSTQWREAFRITSDALQERPNYDDNSQDSSQSRRNTAPR